MSRKCSVDGCNSPKFSLGPFCISCNEKKFGRAVPAFLKRKRRPTCKACALPKKEQSK